MITLIWGGSFLTVQYGLQFSSPILFVALRFAAAAIAVSLISWPHLKQFNRQECVAGFLIGGMIGLGYGTQAIGLQTISSSESAFLTALYVPLVPIFMWICFKKQPNKMMWLGVACAFLGLLLLTVKEFNNLQLQFGQIITLCGAIAIAFEIIFIGYFATRVNIRRLTVLQLFFASFLCFMIAPIAGETSMPAFNWSLISILIGLGIASACIQLVMNWAQQYVESSQAAIIYAGEPVWAALIGRIAGERLPLLSILGGICIVLGVILSEFRPKTNKNQS